MSDTVKSKPVTQVQVNPAVSNGLRNGFIEQTPQETSPSATINGEGSTERQPQCMANGHSLYLVPHASAVIKKLFHNILPLAGVEKDVVKDFEISDIALQRISSNHELLNRVVSLATSYMNSSDKSIESWIDQFRRLGLELSHTTVQSEFRCIVRTLFSDGKNFGRVLSFLTFAVAYAVFVYRLGMKKAVFSVQVWTVEVIERDLSKFFYDNKGWVSQP